MLCSLFLGQNYIIMGQVGEDGRGKIMPNSFIMMFKTKNQKFEISYFLNCRENVNYI